jgi:hypothetical protein
MGDENNKLLFFFFENHQRKEKKKFLERKTAFLLSNHCIKVDQNDEPSEVYAVKMQKLFSF